MLITRLAQNKNEFLVDIYLDDKFFKSVDKNFVVDYALEKGRELLQEELLSLEGKSIVNKLYNLARNRILSRPRSVFEMRQYLLKKERKDILVNETLEKLINDNYLNDKEFCVWWVDNRNTFRSRSNLELKAELLKKGVEINVIKDVLNQYMPEEKESLNLTMLAEKKLKGLEKKSLSQKEKREKLLQFLQRKGYNWDLILKVTKELI